MKDWFQKRESWRDDRVSGHRLSWIRGRAFGKRLVAVELWCNTFDENGPLSSLHGDPVRLPDGRVAWSGGVEIHRTPDDGEKVDWPNCTILAGPCHHDGSSLMAREFFDWWIPGDDCAVWSFLGGRLAAFDIADALIARHNATAGEVSRG